LTTAWTREHLRCLDPVGLQTNVFDAGATTRAIEHLHLWDLWPVRRPDGTKTQFAGTELWIALSAPSLLQPGERHDVARLRLLSHGNGAWSDLGPVFPNDASAGSREWAGCATLGEDDILEVLYTAAGRPGETKPGFEQRIFRAEGRFDAITSRVDAWSPHREVVTPEGSYASTHDQTTGEPGFIKAFRDPFRFEDPVTGDRLVLFTASMPVSTSDFDGAIGLARYDDGDSLTVVPPLITADGVNNELERPHLLRHNGLIYMFFSTQARTFHPEVEGVTGLYGFVSDSIEGDWEPLNGSGLVLANPAEEPNQAYSWLVLDDLSVCSFVDFHTLKGRHPEEVERQGLGREHFGGTPAPIERISVDGTTTRLLAPRAS
jgi:levansucrase